MSGNAPSALSILRIRPDLFMVEECDFDGDYGDLTSLRYQHAIDGEQALPW
jgi:hypothetical protein